MTVGELMTLLEMQAPDDVVWMEGVDGLLIDPVKVVYSDALESGESIVVIS